MTNLATARPEKLESLRCDAFRLFGPVLLREALYRLSRTYGDSCLDQFEKAMVKRIEATEFDIADLDGVREFAVEQLYAAVKDVKAMPDHKQPLEDQTFRRAKGRSEDRITLEEQLQEGLEDSFPASDPPSVVSTTISGRVKHAASPEHIAEKRQAQTRPHV
jgi:hypothetical protein